MSKRTCKDCKNRFSDEGTCPVRFGVTDTDDATKCDTFEPITIFDWVTQSPEKLAKNSVYVYVISDGDGEPEYFFATQWTDDLYETIEAAEAAALARLKEVYVNDEASCNTAESEVENEQKVSELREQRDHH